MSLTLTAAADLHYVNVNSAAPAPPYANWSSAAVTIQDAVDAAAEGDEIVVSNGVYADGGRLVSGSSTTNRVVVDKPITVMSVNGPTVTVIQGQKATTGGSGVDAVRCAYLKNGAVLAGFTLTNGGTSHDSIEEGGGVYCESVNAMVSNCVLTLNWSGVGGGAYSGTLNNCTLTGNSSLTGGGGAYSGTLNNCTLTGNSTKTSGGGADYCTLNNCTLTGNSASNYGGGAYVSTLNNCIEYYNTTWSGSTYTRNTMNYCCTMPPRGPGQGSITNAPLFVDLASGNFRLQTNSPCINSGLNSYSPGLTDLDGRPRIVGDTVDIGAYETHPGINGAFLGWLQSYGLPTDGSADYTDADADGMNNWQEWQCRTVPTNALSALRMLAITPADTNVTVTWQSVSGMSYFLERGTNLSSYPAFWLLTTNCLGQIGTTSYTDTNAASLFPLFYRVGVAN